MREWLAEAQCRHAVLAQTGPAVKKDAFDCTPSFAAPPFSLFSSLLFSLCPLPHMLTLCAHATSGA